MQTNPRYSSESSIHTNASTHVQYFEQAFVFTQGVTALTTTTTKFGIATKDLIGKSEYLKFVPYVDSVIPGIQSRTIAVKSSLSLVACSTQGVQSGSQQQKSKKSGSFNMSLSFRTILAASFLMATR